LTIGYNKSKKNVYIIFILMDLIVMCMTLRARAFVCAGLYLYLITMFKFKINKFLVVLGGLLLVFVLGRNMFEEYFIETNSSQRSLLLQYGFISLKNRFPFGYGFSTFGSYSSAHNYYSPLYSLYSLDTKFGLTADNPSVLNDNYWPMIFGQFGFIGTILIITIYFILFKNVLHQIKNKTISCKVSVMLLVMMLFINSISSSSFVHTHAICYAILICAAINFDGCKEEYFELQLKKEEYSQNFLTL